MIRIIAAVILFFLHDYFLAGQNRVDPFPVQISGVYPHLTVYNPGDSEVDCSSDGHETGIGGIVPWAGKLWLITYSPHCPEGSSDKLWTIDENLKLQMHPQSIGGTPANRFVHRESNQLIIGPHFIDQKGVVRTIPYTRMPGRHTAVARHLTDPQNQVYFQEMEGEMYEVNVYDLSVKKLFHKPVPGWHSKGAYTGQGRYVMSNNGEHKVFDIDKALLEAGGEPRNPDEMGVLAEWDGETWRIVERKQFTEVTGPGGIYGNRSEQDPIWSFGWDRNSVILKLLDGGKWFTFRLPKATHAYDHWGGWYTEWPRIREVGNGRMLMDAHGMFYDFPKEFSAANYGGLLPISSHLRYVPDFCEWNGQLVLATDETATTGNPIPGRSMSNLWFGSWEDLQEWGPKNGYGGPWSKDPVKAGQASVPFLTAGFGEIVLHLAHDNFAPVEFRIEYDAQGDGNWQTHRTLSVPRKSYEYYLFPPDFKAAWVRVVSNTDCRATAFFHLQERIYDPRDTEGMFDGLAELGEAKEPYAAILRPAAHNLNLQVLSRQKGSWNYLEMDENLQFTEAPDRSAELWDRLELKADFSVDEASVIMERNGVRVRLPKGDARYDTTFAAGWPRGIREVESERYLMNIHGSFYEMPREAGLLALRPVASHNKQIIDYCTWRGLLVISGVKANAKADGHVFRAKDRKNALWLGSIDDLWKLGKPVGEGGPWKNTSVEAHVASDPYLMTGYDRKELRLSHEHDEPVRFTIEVDVDHHSGWHVYRKITVAPGQERLYQFEDGYQAHWVRLRADKDCVATAQFRYQ
jgi:hypothetical protein